MVNPRSGRLGREISGLNPGYGAWAIATGIMLTGLAQYGEHAPSEVLLSLDFFECHIFPIYGRSELRICSEKLDHLVGLAGFPNELWHKKHAKRETLVI